MSSTKESVKQKVLDAEAMADINILFEASQEPSEDTVLLYLDVLSELKEQQQPKNIDRYLYYVLNVNTSGYTPLMICALRGYNKSTTKMIRLGAETHHTSMAGFDFICCKLLHTGDLLKAFSNASLLKNMRMCCIECDKLDPVVRMDMSYAAKAVKGIKIPNSASTHKHEFERCSKCMWVSYCNRECQIKNWTHHKTSCNEGKEDREKCRKQQRERGTIVRVSGDSDYKKQIIDDLCLWLECDTQSLSSTLCSFWKELGET
jgi:hypothetical protein